MKHFLASGARPRGSRIVALIGAAAVLVAGAISTSAAPAQTAVSCAATYTIDGSWQGGFQGAVKLTNTGDPLTSWNLTWTFANGQRISQLWNGTVTQTGNSVSVRNLGYNASVGTNGSVSVGFLGSWTGTNAIPTDIAVNGVRCGDAGTGTNVAPTVSLTAPVAGTSYSAPATIPLSATASDSDGSIAKVEYYSDATLIATSTTSPFSASWTGVPVGNYSITAKAFDNLGLSTTSTPAGISVTAGATVRATPATMTVPVGSTVSYTVVLSRAPTANVTLDTTRASGSTNLSVRTGAALTFTPANWATPQTVVVGSASGGTPGTATFSTVGTGYAAATVSVTSVAASTSTYDQRFLTMYNKLKDPANGYFSPEGVPYHSIETLIVEAPDHGHQTTSEAFSYWMWVEATYGRITGNWEGYNTSWAITERYIIPSRADQPTNSGYNPADPATYAPESDNQADYPVALDNAVPVGADPIAGELRSAYGSDDIYGMHWLIDVDNVYGFGRCGDGTTKPAYINTFQRGSSESTWETITQPSCDTFAFGGRNGYLDLFTEDSSYAKQWKFTNAPDADARVVQAAYWADKWATAQGKQGTIAANVAKAAKMGDYLRYATFDKYFKRIGNCTNPMSCPGGTGRQAQHYLISWYYAWGGSLDTTGAWAWRIGTGAAHQGYQNPMAAWAMSTVPALQPKSATGATDWGTSLTRQLEFYQWLQSADGAIAGGATNSWQGKYATPPAGTPTFYGMFYDYKPVWHDPESNKWFGFQAWSMERVAEYYYATGNAKAKAILDKWVAWALANSSVAANGSYQIPSDLAWTGQPDTWNAANPGSNAGLRVTVTSRTNDIGVAGSYAKVLTYYAARSGNVPAKAFAKALLDGIWANNQDAKGVSVTETRTDYSRFNEKIYVPPNWTGRMPNGDPINSSSTFLSIRSFYKNDPDWPKVQAYLNGGAAPQFNYHRFWAQSDVATAMAVYGELFGE